MDCLAGKMRYAFFCSQELLTCIENLLILRDYSNFELRALLAALIIGWSSKLALNQQFSLNPFI